MFGGLTMPSNKYGPKSYRKSVYPWLTVCIGAFCLAGAANAVQPTTYTYDGLGRVRLVTFPDNSTVVYNYDSAGNRVQADRAARANHAPVAVADATTTAYQTASTFDPRVNDTDVDGDALAITATGGATHGTVTFTGTSVTYTPTAGYSGADSFTYTISDGHGGTATGTVSVTVQSQSSQTTIQVTAVSNLRTLATNAGYTGASPGNYLFNVASGVTVTAASGGGLAIDTGTWPTGSTISLVVSGNIYGGGGNGGAGSSTGGGSNGGAGGDAVAVHAPVTVTVNAGGSIQSGGGGGGGGGYASGTVGGDGGGGGFPNGVGGAGSSGTVHDAIAPGNPGTTAGGGTGGSGGPPGGAGGNAGTAGAAGTSSAGTGGAGGAAGYAIRKNANTVTYTNNGTVNGTVG